ncbi:DUF1653 domain-containing protein [Serratia marcescens]|uniref:DUF1653 domain-containing protein n=1 Tax=Serratia marcescens TaxID=615 RepID=A0A5C7BKW4_SERMA|nr:DUF1653 domain-containing protein [Serratia marcescens]TXE53365.1 DUF1653 domain-containing protein [Serratia marcescens]
MNRPGRYQHYKGKTYVVIGVALHTETKEYFVVYYAEHGLLYSKDECSEKYFVRPLDMFNEEVLHNGIYTPRFRFIEDGDGPNE